MPLHGSGIILPSLELDIDQGVKCGLTSRRQSTRSGVQANGNELRKKIRRFARNECWDDEGARSECRRDNFL
jgi:hypothetical protein